jgi:hypothetical protein
MKHTFITGGALFFCALTAFADWTIVTMTDPMTDVTKYSIVTKGEPVAMSDVMKYDPELYFRITPVEYNAKTDRMSYRADVFFAIQTEGLRRGESTVKIRFDRNPAEDTTITSSTERRAGFFANPSGFISKATSSTNLLVRFTTTLGAVRTLKFRVDGLMDQLKEVKKRFKDNRK